MSKVLETNRLVLRRLSVDDAEFILGHLNDPSFHRYIGDRGVRTVEQARQYVVDRVMASYERFGFGIYMVELKDTREQIGTCGLVKREEMEDVEVGFALLPQYWSNGYALEAAQAVMEYGHQELGLSRIVAIVNPGNSRSFKLLEKIGLKFERMIRLSAGDSEIELFTPEGEGQHSVRR